MFVESLSDIEKNVDTLIDAIHSDSDDRTRFTEWVKAGAVFYPYQFGPIIAFAPSRFIGYKNNSREKHERFIANGTADGKDTTWVINRIVKPRNLPDDRLELAFQKYCSLIGVEPYSKKRTFWNNPRIVYAIEQFDSALDDLADSDTSGEDIARKLALISRYPRNPKVRSFVLDRAKGQCEHCGAWGFRKSDGTFYLEAHHIIHLAVQGPDSPDNVIALCPNHHRESHYGESSEKLEAEFKIKLAKIRGS
jgi:5-methylcytosine-specific restriction endonuclease McrA